jgi:serine/threonine-protein kinase
VGSRRIQVMHGDIVKAGTEAIVCPADTELSGQSGRVAHYIHRAAGPELLEMLRSLGRCSTGSAVLTGAGRIPPPTRAVIHAVGPSYAPTRECALLLRSAYETSLRLAEQKGIRSIAFPALSRGGVTYQYPMELVARIALNVAAMHLVSDAGSVELIAFVLPSGYEVFVKALAVALRRARG